MPEITPKIDNKIKSLENRQEKNKNMLIGFIFLFLLGIILLYWSSSNATNHYIKFTYPSGVIIIFASLFFMIKIRNLTKEEKIFFNFYHVQKNIRDYIETSDDEYKKISIKFLDENINLLKNPISYADWSTTKEFEEELKRTADNVEKRFLPSINKFIPKEDPKKILGLSEKILITFFNPDINSVKDLNELLKASMMEGIVERENFVKSIKDFFDSRPILKKIVMYPTAVIVIISLSMLLTYIIALLFVLDFKTLIAPALALGGALSAVFLNKIVK